MKVGRKREEMNNVLRDEKKGQNRALKKAEGFGFGDFLTKETIERLNQLRKVNNESEI